MLIFKLENAVPQPIPAGVYNGKVNIGTGTSAITYQVLEETPTSIPEFTVSADKDGTLELPDCTLLATLTGDATAIFSKIRD